MCSISFSSSSEVIIFHHRPFFLSNEHDSHEQVSLGEVRRWKTGVCIAVVLELEVQAEVEHSEGVGAAVAAVVVVVVAVAVA